MNKIIKIVDIFLHLGMILTCILALIFLPYNDWWIANTLVWVSISFLKAIIISKLEDKIEEITKF